MIKAHSLVSKCSLSLSLSLSTLACHLPWPSMTRQFSQNHFIHHRLQVQLSSSILCTLEIILLFYEEAWNFSPKTLVSPSVGCDSLFAIQGLQGCGVSLSSFLFHKYILVAPPTPSPFPLDSGCDAYRQVSFIRCCCLSWRSCYLSPFLLLVWWAFNCLFLVSGTGFLLIFPASCFSLHSWFSFLFSNNVPG